MNGFFNRILTIDLTERSHKVEDIPDSVLERYLGGKGLGTYLLLRDNPPGATTSLAYLAVEPPPSK
jgi:aldehyde:ferredoxin oxidoreductase